LLPIVRKVLTALATLLAVTVPPSAFAQPPVLAPLATGAAMPPSPWQVQGLPAQKMPMTRFALVDLDGRRALRVDAERSYGNLVHPLEPAATAPFRLAWSWRVDRPVAADLRSKAGDDTALKVCVFFDLALEKIPFGERQLLRLVRARTQEHLPGATLCYVWDSDLAAGTVLPNAYTRRMRYLVLQGGAGAAGSATSASGASGAGGTIPTATWRNEQRDVHADFLRVFGDESAQVPPVIGIAIGADTDNTGGRSTAFIADLVVQP
jgi:Protein of unknown function (DUF3047)